MPPNAPIASGRFSSGTVSLVNKGCLDKYRRDSVREYANITRAPENIPPTPRPAMALPTINAVLEGAAPHIREPNSKSEMANRKVPLIYASVQLRATQLGTAVNKTYAERFVDSPECRLQ
jgi:hypothetical protein